MKLFLVALQSIALVYLGTYCFGVGIWRAVVFEGFPVNHFFRWFLYGELFSMSDGDIQYYCTVEVIRFD